MADESDGIEEAFDGQLRIAVTAAGRVGEALARAREEAARRAQAQSEQAARELSSRFEAEKRAARVELGSVHRSDWWDKATPQQIGGALTTARAWGTEDPEAQRAEEQRNKTTGSPVPPQVEPARPRTTTKPGADRGPER